ncbi:hypothetical protein [Salinisphaera aquimarina]|uniref:DUF2336 domain-containing protein n=1 Tax=Salinisphaera aquimarina TaxID=2094031 RepID=A0ABV7ERL5_9GAMM
MRDAATRAELVKLARILDTDLENVEYLSYLEAERLRVLREGITEALFEKFRSSFTGFARLSSLLPLSISARISERVLGPTLSGRIAGEMPPQKAIDMASKLSDDFLADTCLQLDPVRARPIIAGFPVDRAVAITRILLARKEFITMGRFVDVLPRDTLFAATDAIVDEADLLEISFFVENSEQLDQVIDYLGIERREAVIQAAAKEDLWPEVIVTLLRIGHASRTALAELALSQDASTLDSLIRAAAENDLWPALLQLADELPDDAIARLSEQPAFDEPVVIRSVIDSVVANDLWDELQRQLPSMGQARCARLLQVGASERAPFLSELDKRLRTEESELATLRAGAAALDKSTREKALAACGDGALAHILAEAGKP